MGFLNDNYNLQGEIDSVNSIHTDTKEPTGFNLPQDLTHNLSKYIDLSFNETSREFTISPVFDSYEIYLLGKKITKTQSESVTIANEDGNHFIYFDTDGTLKSTRTFQIFFTNGRVQVALIYWNVAEQKCVRLGMESHGCVQDWATQLQLHETDGTRYVNGLIAGNYTLIGDGSNNSDAQISISDGQIDDEDLRFFITHNDTPTEFGEQILSPMAKIPVSYKKGSSGIWDVDEATNYPIKQGTLRAQYNKNTSGTWSTVDASANDSFVAVFLIASSCKNPVTAILGQREDTTLNNAKLNNTYENLSLLDFPYLEVKPLWRLIFQTNSTYTNEPKCKLVDVESLLNIKSLQISAIQTTSHNTLTNRTDIDSHPASAISYNNISSGLTATDIQASTDEINTKVDDINTNFGSSVRGTLLTGISLLTNSVISATDSVLSAFGKLQKQISDNLTTLTNHTSNTTNPHEVTKSQVGLSNVVDLDTSDTSNIIDSLNKRFVTDTEKTNITHSNRTNLDAIDQNLSTLGTPTFAQLTVGDVSNTELQYINGVTSSVQTQLNGKEPSITKKTAFNKDFEVLTDNIKMNGTVSVGSSENLAHSDHIHPTDTSRQSTIIGAATTITDDDLTVDKVLISDENGKVSASTVGTTELGYISTLTSNAQTQINGKEPTILVKNTAFNKNFETVDSNIKMNGVASVGSSDTIANADHVHPVDTSRQAVITGGASTILSDNLTASKAVVSDTNGKVVTSLTTSTEIGYVHGVTSDIQTQINGKEASIGTKNTAFNQNFETNTSNIKSNGTVSVGTSSNIPRADHVHPTDTTRQATITGAITTVLDTDLTTDKVVITNNNGKIAVSNTTANEIGFVSGVTSSIQTQLNSKNSIPTYGSMYEDASASPTTINLTTATTYYKWINSTVGITSGITHSSANDNLTVNTGSDGVYLVNVDLAGIFSRSNTIYTMAVYKNNAITNLRTYFRTSNAGNMTGMSLNGFLSLAATDTVDLRFTSAQSGDTLSVYNINFLIKRV